MEDCYISLEELSNKVSEFDSVIYVSSNGFNDSIEYVPNVEKIFKYLNMDNVSDSFSFVPNYLKRVEAEEKLNAN